jgi:tRNA(Ile2) C34 agmatinyltransferase TiaS
MGVPQIFAELAKSEVKVSFGEGDKKVEKPMVEVFADFFRGIQEIVPVAEIAKGAAKTGKVLNFNESKGIALAEGSVELKEDREKIATEKKISFGEALKIARSENPQLVQAGTGTGGAV